MDDCTADTQEDSFDIVSVRTEEEHTEIRTCPARIWSTAVSTFTVPWLSKQISKFIINKVDTLTVPEEYVRFVVAVVYSVASTFLFLHTFSSLSYPNLPSR